MYFVSIFTVSTTAIIIILYHNTGGDPLFLLEKPLAKEIMNNDS